MKASYHCSKTKVETLSSQIEASTKEIKEFQAKGIYESRGHKISPPNFPNLPPKPISPGSNANETLTINETYEMSPNLNDISTDATIRPLHKKRKLQNRTKSLLNEVEVICESHRESLGTVLGHRILCEDESAMITLDKVVETVIEQKGTKKGFESVFSEEKWESYFKTLRKPDWVLLYFKLKSKLPDDGWQTLLNITNLGQSGVSKA